MIYSSLLRLKDLLKKACGIVHLCLGSLRSLEVVGIRYFMKHCDIGLNNAEEQDLKGVTTMMWGLQQQ